jgi:hypothetical protein
VGLHDLKRPHYNCIEDPANQIATHLSGARKDKKGRAGNDRGERRKIETSISLTAS